MTRERGVTLEFELRRTNRYQLVGSTRTHDESWNLINHSNQNQLQQKPITKSQTLAPTSIRTMHLKTNKQTDINHNNKTHTRRKKKIKWILIKQKLMITEGCKGKKSQIKLMEFFLVKFIGENALPQNSLSYSDFSAEKKKREISVVKPKPDQSLNHIKSLR